MGVVYKARQTGLNRLAAVKMILGGDRAGPDAEARFRTEAEAVARVRHPNIVQIYEIGECDGLSFLALEYVEGGSLARSGDPEVPPGGSDGCGPGSGRLVQLRLLLSRPPGRNATAPGRPPRPPRRPHRDPRRPRPRRCVSGAEGTLPSVRPTSDAAI